MLIIMRTGGATIWEHRYDHNIISLYFANKKGDKTDIRWDGTYPNGYFNN